MKKFLFIVPLTPSDYLTPLRRELFQLFLSSLKKQTYTNWQALLIGEEEKIDENIVYKRIAGKTKEIKLMYSYEYISSLAEKPDYLIRLDDDDLISPYVLERAALSKINFDCYADKYHAYYDVVSGRVCQVKNPWLPNTVIHKFEHALAKTSLDNISLYLLDHSKNWKQYYFDKKVLFENKSTPVYLRIMSPTASTSQMRSLKLEGFSEDILSRYQGNIKQIGYWRYIQMPDFGSEIDQLISIWRKVSGHSINIPANKSIVNLKNRIEIFVNNIIN